MCGEGGRTPKLISMETQQKVAAVCYPGYHDHIMKSRGVIYDQAVEIAIKDGCSLQYLDRELNVQAVVKFGLDSGNLTRYYLEENIRGLIQVNHSLGLDNMQNIYNKLNASSLDGGKRDELAEYAAMQSFVLLKNLNNTLPLTRTYNKLVVFGTAANDAELMVGNKKHNFHVITPIMGLKNLAKRTKYLPKVSSESEAAEALAGADLIVLTVPEGEVIQASIN